MLRDPSEEQAKQEGKHASLVERIKQHANHLVQIVQKLNEAINRAIQASDFRERLQASAFDPVGGTQSQVAEYVRSEIVKWGKVVRDTGAKPD